MITCYDILFSWGMIHFTFKRGINVLQCLDDCSASASVHMMEAEVISGTLEIQSTLSRRSPKKILR
jgi:hypothetical protein